MFCLPCPTLGSMIMRSSFQSLYSSQIDFRVYPLRNSPGQLAFDKCLEVQQGLLVLLPIFSISIRDKESGINAGSYLHELHGNVQSHPGNSTASRQHIHDRGGREPLLVAMQRICYQVLLRLDFEALEQGCDTYFKASIAFLRNVCCIYSQKPLPRLPSTQSCDLW